MGRVMDMASRGAWWWYRDFSEVHVTKSLRLVVLHARPRRIRNYIALRLHKLVGASQRLQIPVSTAHHEQTFGRSIIVGQDRNMLSV
jgi:hypothetical protein